MTNKKTSVADTSTDQVIRQARETSVGRLYVPNSLRAHVRTVSTKSGTRVQVSKK